MTGEDALAISQSDDYRSEPIKGDVANGVRVNAVRTEEHGWVDADHVIPQKSMQQRRLENCEDVAGW